MDEGDMPDLTEPSTSLSLVGPSVKFALIEFYYNHPVLWDMSKDIYHDRTKNFKAEEEMAAAFPDFTGKS